MLYLDIIIILLGPKYVLYRCKILIHKSKSWELKINCYYDYQSIKNKTKNSIPKLCK